MGAVQFKVLGPLEAVRDERRLGLGGRKPRAVLAALLLGDGRHVRTDALVDAVWGDAAPATAVKAVHKHVSFLRRQLGDPRLIVTRPDGYELPAADLDRRRFDRLVDEAAADREPERRAARLAEALALWRGEPYLDLGDLPAAGAERRRLEERRLAAVEALAAARLELGQHRALVGWLEQLVAAHPLHERLWGLLMLALYRSGRQADALAAYRRLRATLVEQLGVEPSPELRRLHQQVLGQHQALAPAGAEPAGGPGNLPRQLTSFVGRDTELAELAALTAAHRAVTLTGAAGAGKTRLALELAARVPGPSTATAPGWPSWPRQRRTRCRWPSPGPSGSPTSPAGPRPRRWPTTWAAAGCCWSSTTPSTWWTRWPAWSSRCCGRRPGCTCWPPAASRSASPARSPTRWPRCRSRRPTAPPTSTPPKPSGC